MKQKVNARFDNQDTVTIVIDKNGMSINGDKSLSYRGDDIVQSFLTRLVNLDHWQHSWHMSISRAQMRGSEERKEVRRILKEKIARREAEIQELKNGIQILGRWNTSTFRN